jgi:hypothetical protein
MARTMIRAALVLLTLLAAANAAYAPHRHAALPFVTSEGCVLTPR